LEIILPKVNWIGFGTTILGLIYNIYLINFSKMLNPIFGPLGTGGWDTVW
jgi:hypothetical protein